jgi:KTSC domain
MVGCRGARRATNTSLHPASEPTARARRAGRLSTPEARGPRRKPTPRAMTTRSRRFRGTSSCCSARSRCTSATARCRVWSGSSGCCDPRVASPSGVATHSCPRRTGCGAAWLARRSGGPKVPGSSPGSPTNEVAGQGSAHGHDSTPRGRNDSRLTARIALLCVFLALGLTATSCATTESPGTTSTGEWVEVDASNLAAVRYDFASGDLDIEFHSGETYRYFGVPEDLYEQLLDPPGGSHGNTSGRTFAMSLRTRSCSEGGDVSPSPPPSRPRAPRSPGGSGSA